MCFPRQPSDDFSEPAALLRGVPGGVLRAADQPRRFLTLPFGGYIQCPEEGQQLVLFVNAAHRFVLQLCGDLRHGFPQSLRFGREFVHQESISPLFLTLYRKRRRSSSKEIENRATRRRGCML
jgi:hypothetical protein